MLLEAAAILFVALALGGSKPVSGGASTPPKGSGGALGDDDEVYDDIGDDSLPDPPAGEQELFACDDVSADGGWHAGMTYSEIVTGGADPNAYLPMIIALHGLGQDKEYLENKLKDFHMPARIIIPDAFYDRTGGRPGRRWWRGSHPGGLQGLMTDRIPEASDLLAEFVDDMPHCRPTLGLPVVAGHSQGGYVALDFAASHPELIRAVVPSAAWRPVALWDIEPVAPVFAIHGAHDTGVPYDRSLEYYDEMIARGAPVHLRTTSGAHSLGSTNLAAWQEEMALAIS